MKLRVLIVLVLFVLGVFAYRSRAASARAAANEALYVPVIMSPSIQPVSGQTVLFKATNITEAPVGFRMMLFGDHDGLPAQIQDFPKVNPGTTVSYEYTPPMGELQIGGTTVAAPQAFRATFAPLPAGDPDAIRRVVASAQIMRLQTSGPGAPVLDPPIVVHLERCRFEPRNFVPYTGGRWVWNCAPEMSPIIERERRR